MIERAKIANLCIVTFYDQVTMNDTMVKLSRDWDLTNPVQTISVNNGKPFAVQCLKSNANGEYVIQYHGTMVCEITVILF